ncbi:unnamed protein product, partial [Brachionus calyciflorus]
MEGSASHAFLTNKCCIFKTAVDIDDILSSIRDFVQMTLVDFTNSIIEEMGEDNNNSKKDLRQNFNKIRIKLAQYVKSYLKLDANLKILNRHKVKQMAKDVWYLLISIEEKKLQAECDVYKHSNITTNDSFLNGSQINNINPDFNRLFDKLFDEINELKRANEAILKSLDGIKTENVALKKLINKQFRLKNFNFYNQDENLKSDCVEVGNENNFEEMKDIDTRSQQNENLKFKTPMPVDQHNYPKPTYLAVSRQNSIKDHYDIKKKNSKKNSCVIGSNEKSDIKSASKIFHFYVGFCEKKTTEESLKNYINSFAQVEKIETLDTKDRNYSSFHVQVYSHHNDKMLDSNNWTKGVKVKRYFFTTEKTNGYRYNKIDNNRKNENEDPLNNERTISNKNTRTSVRGRSSCRGASNSMRRENGKVTFSNNNVNLNRNFELNLLPPVPSTPKQPNFSGYPFLRSPVKTPNKR